MEGGRKGKKPKRLRGRRGEDHRTADSPAPRKRRIENRWARGADNVRKGQAALPLRALHFLCNQC